MNVLIVKNLEVKTTDCFCVNFNIDKDFNFQIKYDPFSLSISTYFVIKNRKCFYDWILNKCHVLPEYDRTDILKIYFTSLKFIVCCFEDFIFLFEDKKKYVDRTMKIYNAYKAIKYNNRTEKTVAISSNY